MARSLKRRKFSMEDTQTALLTLASVAGDCKEAAKLLALDGISIDARLLRHWKSQTHAVRYEELAAKHGEEVEKVIVNRSRQIAVKAADVAMELLHETSKQLAEGKIRDPAGSARNAATVSGIHVDKILALTGRAQTTIELRPAGDIFRALSERVPGLVIDGTAVEVPAPALVTSNEATREPEGAAECRT